MRAAEVTAAAMPKLEKLTDLEEFWVEVNRLENEADRIYRRTLGRLFGGEYDALEVLKWKDIIEALEAALNTLEDVSNVVESIVLKHA